MPQAAVSLHQPADDTTMLSIDEVLNPFVQTAAAYWNELRGDRRFPARDEITLRGAAAILPYTVIAAVIGDDYEYRYVGDAQRQAFGAYFKGVRVSRIERDLPRVGALLRNAYDAVRGSGIPFAVRGRAGHDDPQFVYHETAFLPLGVGDAAVDHILIVGVFVPTPFWEVPPDQMKRLTASLRSAG